jgi:hypothetical protein
MVSLRVLRNVAIVAGIAAVVKYVPEGGTAATTVEAALLAALGAGFGFIALRLYREHRISLSSLGDRHRALLYSAIAVGLLLWAGRARMWETGAGEIIWFALLAYAVYAALEVFRHARSY